MRGCLWMAENYRGPAPTLQGMEEIVLPDHVVRTKELLAAGWTRDGIRRAVEKGHLTRIRQGWYATPLADERVLRAVRSGGALACASALAHHGAWDVTAGVVHTRMDHNRVGSLPAGLKRCQAWHSKLDVAPEQAVDDLAMALRTAWNCLSLEGFLVVCDSLLHRNLMTRHELSRALRHAPGKEVVLDKTDRAESGTETMVRYRLRSRRVQLTPQVEIPGVGRVDFLVGERLVIEVDSRGHHTGEENYQKDRARDLTLRAMGYIVVRLTYQQVVHDWPETERCLVAMIQRGDQWWGSRRGRKLA